GRQGRPSGCLGHREDLLSGAVADMGGREASEVRRTLGELSRRELVRPVAESSLQGEDEYGFWHALVRDVCYSQIPRAARSVKHRSAARWVERTGGARVEDHAEVLAHHYTTALELARAAGEAAQAAELEPPALRFLMLAGDRALGLDVERAEAHYT